MLVMLVIATQLVMLVQPFQCCCCRADAFPTRKLIFS